MSWVRICGCGESADAVLRYCVEHALHARIGSHGKHVHGLAEYRESVDPPPGIAAVGCTWPVRWGASLCGGWAGEARLTEEPVSCPRCQAEMRRAKP